MHDQINKIIFSQVNAHISLGVCWAWLVFTQASRLECVMENYTFYFSTKTYVVGTQKNRLDETGFFEHQKGMLKLTGKK